MQRTCGACGAAYEARSARSKFCTDSECKRARERARNRQRRDPGGEVVEFPAPQADGEGGANERVTRRELDAAGRLETIAGQNAMSLARQLDHAAGDTGSSFAALAKQHLLAVDKALEGVEVADDPIERRRQAAHARRLSVVR